MKTISKNTDPLVAVIFALTGGKFLLRKNEMGFTDVVDAAGEVIGSAHRSGIGWAIHTSAYGGYADDHEVVFV